MRGPDNNINNNNDATDPNADLDNPTMGEVCSNAMGRAADQAANFLDIVRRGGQRSVYTPPGWEDDADDESGGAVLAAAGAASSLPNPDELPREPKKSLWSKIKNPCDGIMEEWREGSGMDCEIFVERNFKMMMAIIVFCLLLVSVEVIVFMHPNNGVMVHSNDGGGDDGSGDISTEAVGLPPTADLPPIDTSSSSTTATTTSSITVGQKPPDDIYILNPPSSNNPTLPSSERVAAIQTKLELISGPSIKKQNTNQYYAMNWILHQDAFQLNPRSPYLIQRYVLALFYFSLGGKRGNGWDVDDLVEVQKKGVKWLDGESGECAWVGVECNDDAFVVILDLDSFGLSGQLPKEVAELRYLTQLYLNNNKISGQIPDEWGHMIKLEQLLLDNNYLFGTVSQSICNLHDNGVLQVITTDCTSESMSVYCACCMNCPDNTNQIPPPASSGSVGGGSVVGNDSKTSNSNDNIIINNADNEENHIRSIDIAARIGQISGGDVTAQPNTPQHDAMMWIIDHDKLQLNENDVHLLQRYIVATLYYATDGMNWSYSEWLRSDVRECDYPGVRCNEEGDVVVLSLSASNLKGPIPIELSFLPHLQSLDLSDNNLFGEVPARFGDLENLQKLLLHDNDITGVIPEALCKIRSLTQIWVDCDVSPMKVYCSCCSNCEGTTSAAAAATTTTTAASSSSSLPEPGQSQNTQSASGENVASTSETVAPDEDSENSVTNEISTPSEATITNAVSTPSETTASNVAASQSETAAPVDPVPSQPITTNVVSSEDRAAAITSKIVDALEITHPATLSWIINDDVKQLSADDPHLVQRYVMVLLYNMLDGDNWTKKAKWLLGEIRECEWEGVECNDSGEITSIILKSGNLKGSLPPEISVLNQLKVFDLSDNAVTRSIPSSFGMLPSLRILFLYGNDLSGEVPPDICALLEEGELAELWVDCESNPPKVKCDCCTKCGAE